VKTRIGFLFLLVAVLPVQLILLQPRLWAQSTTTLLATTDLDCTWKLDGQLQGALKADDATVVPLSLGKHLVQATSADGLDQWKTVVTVTQAGQEMVEIKLKEAHQKRMAETQPAAPATPTAIQPLQPPATQSAIQPTAIQPTEDPTWTDPATRLMWAGKDNGKNVTWVQAKSYCASLTLAAYSDWRLPTIAELAGIYDETQDVNGWHIKGGIRVSGWEWSSEARSEVEHRLFTFHNVKKDPILVATSRRALCVRPAGQ
jgi:hypothetical protein